MIAAVWTHPDGHTYPVVIVWFHPFRDDHNEARTSCVVATANGTMQFAPLEELAVTGDTFDAFFGEAQGQPRPRVHVVDDTAYDMAEYTSKTGEYQWLKKK